MSSIKQYFDRKRGMEVSNLRSSKAVLFRIATVSLREYILKPSWKG